jgi:hypothetical protein
LTNDTTNHDNNAMAARPWLTAAVVDVLHRYRGVCAERTSRAQLVLPDALRLLPVYVLGALKHPAFLNGRGVRASERAVALRRLRRLGVGALGPALYPRMTALRPYLECEDVEDMTVVPASSEGLASDGLYLLDDGSDDVWLWVGRAVPEELLSHVNTVTGEAPRDLIRAEIVIFDTDHGGAVFAVGSITFCGSLSHHGTKNPISRLLDNVVRRFSA